MKLKALIFGLMCVMVMSFAFVAEESVARTFTINNRSSYSPHYNVLDLNGNSLYHSGVRSGR